MREWQSNLAELLERLSAGKSRLPACRLPTELELTKLLIQLSVKGLESREGARATLDMGQ